MSRTLLGGLQVFWFSGIATFDFAAVVVWMILPLVVAGGVSAAGSVVFCLFVVFFFWGGGGGCRAELVANIWLSCFECPFQKGA